MIVTHVDIPLRDEFGLETDGFDGINHFHRRALDIVVVVVWEEGGIKDDLSLAGDNID
jgi:hypothetical protein